MTNPLSQFLTNRLIKPQVDAQVADVLERSLPPAAGTAISAEPTLAQAVGQPHDANYARFYSLYKLNTDVAACVHKWAEGITGPGWLLTTMDPDLDHDDGLSRQMDDISRWLRRPNPHKHLRLLLYELVEHLAITGDAFWYVLRDRKGKPLETWPKHPALTKVVSTKQGEVSGYVMRDPSSGETTRFRPEKVLHFRLPNPGHDLYSESPLELVLEEAGIDLRALRSNKAIFTNGLAPSAFLLLDEQASINDARILSKQIELAHRGAGNRHKVMAVARVFVDHNAGDYAAMTRNLPCRTDIRRMHQRVPRPVEGEAPTRSGPAHGLAERVFRGPRSRSGRYPVGALMPTCLDACRGRSHPPGADTHAGIDCRGRAT